MLPTGTRLGPYEILGLIGEGGMGQVYRAAVEVRSRYRVSPLMITAAVLLAAIGAFTAWFFTSHRQEEPIRVHAFLLPPDGNYLTGGLALSPDGRTLAFVAADAGGERQLWIRALDAARAQPVAGTNGATDVFWFASTVASRCA